MEKARRDHWRVRRPRWPWVLGAAGLVVAAGLAVALWGTGPVAAPPGRAALVMYQPPTCGCCARYAEYLAASGFPARVVKTEDMAAVKRRLGVPRSLEACHTVAVEGYFVEGHVPREAITRLLADRPRVLGVALPGMPSGSLGMDGPKEGPLVVYAVTGPGAWREFGRF